MRRNRLYLQEPPGIDKKSSITYELISLFGKCNNAPILVENFKFKPVSSIYKISVNRKQLFSIFYLTCKISNRVPLRPA